MSQWLGVVVPLLPVAFLAGMIAVTDGFGSTYYAALNLVLLAVGAVLAVILIIRANRRPRGSLISSSMQDDPPRK